MAGYPKEGKSDSLRDSLEKGENNYVGRTRTAVLLASALAP